MGAQTLKVPEILGSDAQLLDDATRTSGAKAGSHLKWIETLRARQQLQFRTAIAFPSFTASTTFQVAGEQRSSGIARGLTQTCLTIVLVLSRTFYLCVEHPRVATASATGWHSRSDLHAGPTGI